ncbi:MAG TPA: hypothetical protein VLF93_07660 [Candidatus Saccharimonadales bacterium]|nr:hypothetical protein [Candidatus Saccharimonadales bacterium]
MKFSKDEALFLLATFLFGVSLMLIIFKVIGLTHKANTVVTPPAKHWQIESIDTMKYSRDLAKQGLNNVTYASEVNKQVAEIAGTGANFIAIDTPYDDEFSPILKMWVKAARENNLHIWFRGNFAGWEGWFDYPRIDEATHMEKTKQFILDNKDMFQEGDIFTACPECENGLSLNPGDPTQVANFRSFLITEYDMENQTFASIGKNVSTSYISMNADVARAVMDKQTTQELGGIVVIDHYVQTPQQLANDVRAIGEQSGGKVVLGEFGAPIPDIQGTMTDEQQTQWILTSLQLLSLDKNLIGVNYWVNVNGSTALWRADDTPKPAVSVITSYFQ